MLHMPANPPATVLFRGSQKRDSQKAKPKHKRENTLQVSKTREDEEEDEEVFEVDIDPMAPEQVITTGELVLKTAFDAERNLQLFAQSYPYAMSFAQIIEGRSEWVKGNANKARQCWIRARNSAFTYKIPYALALCEMMMANFYVTKEVALVKRETEATAALEGVLEVCVNCLNMNAAGLTEHPYFHRLSSLAPDALTNQSQRNSNVSQASVRGAVSGFRRTESYATLSEDEEKLLANMTSLVNFEDRCDNNDDFEREGSNDTLQHSDVFSRKNSESRLSLGGRGHSRDGSLNKGDLGKTGEEGGDDEGGKRSGTFNASPLIRKKQNALPTIVEPEKEDSRSGIYGRALYGSFSRQNSNSKLTAEQDLQNKNIVSLSTSNSSFSTASSTRPHHIPKISLAFNEADDFLLMTSIGGNIVCEEDSDEESNANNRAKPNEKSPPTSHHYSQDLIAEESENEGGDDDEEEELDPLLTQYLRESVGAKPAFQASSAASSAATAKSKHDMERVFRALSLNIGSSANQPPSTVKVGSLPSSKSPAAVADSPALVANAISSTSSKGPSFHRPSFSLEDASAPLLMPLESELLASPTAASSSSYTTSSSHTAVSNKKQGQDGSENRASVASTFWAEEPMV